MTRYVSTLTLILVAIGLIVLILGKQIVRDIVEGSFAIQKQEDRPLKEQYSLVEASSLGNIERVRRLIRDKDISPNVVDPLGRSPLRSAIESGYYEIAKFLIENGANVNEVDYEGNSPLILTVRLGRVELFDLLVEKGAKLNYRSPIGRTALYEAVLNGNYIIADKLLSAGADPLAIDIYGNTLLHAAVMSENIPTLSKVLTTSINIDSQNRSGITPLGLAVSHQLIPQVKVLIDYGASVSIRDTERQNVLTLAVRSDELKRQRQDQIANEIESLGKKKTAEEIKEIKLQDLRKTQHIVKMILKNAPRGDLTLINSVDRYLRTPLMYASMSGNFLVVEELIKAGANLNRQDESGMTALHYATEAGYSVIAEDLLLAGANINLKNNQGRSPVQLAQDLGKSNVEKVLTRQAQEATRQ
ncbi:MAG: ankyrin repeat domain-containing protein [Candidatus Caldatribacteriota bacterium]